jgi:hypothetical protein
LELFTGVKNLATDSFKGCTSLKSITLPVKITSLPDGSFEMCTSLQSINIEDLTSIGSRCFRDTQLSGSLNLPKLEHLGWNAFQRTKIKNITSLGKITTINGSAFNDTPIEHIVLPLTIISIGDYAFNNCLSLTDLTNIENFEYVQNIGIGAFQNSNNVTGIVNLPNLKGTLGNGAFRGTKVTSVENLGSITIIDNYAFLGDNRIEFIQLPSTLTSIGGQAFDCTQASNNKCKTIICHATTPPTLGANAFRGRTSTSTFYVPDASLDDYKAATNWSAFASRIKGISELP